LPFNSLILSSEN